jgi:hypothetical protein
VRRSRCGWWLLLAAWLAAGCSSSQPTRPPEPVTRLDSADAVVEELERSYAERDLPALARLYSSAPVAPFEFIYPDTSGGFSTWDLDEELRLHRRMFEPSLVLPGETAPPPELRVESVTIQLGALGAAMERLDLYVGPANPDGLDPARWGAWEIVSGTHLLCDLQGETDFLIEGQASFVLLEDRGAGADPEARFQLWRWEELPGSAARPRHPARPAGVEEVRWSTLKRLYR